MSQSEQYGTTGESDSLWKSFPFQKKLHFSLHQSTVQNLLHHVLLLLFLLCCSWCCSRCRCWCCSCACSCGCRLLLLLLLLLSLLALLSCYGRQLVVCSGCLWWSHENTCKENSEMVTRVWHISCTKTEITNKGKVTKSSNRILKHTTR